MLTGRFQILVVVPLRPRVVPPGSVAETAVSALLSWVLVGAERFSISTSTYSVLPCWRENRAPMWTKLPMVMTARVAETPKAELVASKTIPVGWVRR